MLLRKVEYSLCLSKESASGDGVESFGKNGTRTGLALPTPSEHFHFFSERKLEFLSVSCEDDDEGVYSQ